jgi:hypothetical protein
MKNVDFGRCALGICLAAAMLAGCGGSQPPIGAPGAMAQNRAAAAHPDHSGSWMLPEAKSEALLYLSAGQGGESGFVKVFSYPQGKLVGTVTGLYEPFGECVDSSGDVFVVAYANPSLNASNIYEYAHGGTTPIATLNDPGVGWGCSVDPTTGNLAVTGGDPSYPDEGAVAIYAAAQGTPTMYYSSAFKAFGNCGYDNTGNLYLDGALVSTQIGFARLAGGSQSIQTISLNKPIYTVGGFLPSVQWDGNNVTISSFPNKEGTGTLLIYQLKISGNSATVKGTSELKSQKHVGHLGQTWIFEKTVVGAEDGDNFGKASYWNYPEGGKPTSTIEDATDLRKGSPWGAAISPAQ